MEHQVPTVNLADFLSKGLSAIDQPALVRACEDHGFFLLEEHGQEQLVADVFAQAENFFAQPTLMKHSVYRNCLLYTSPSPRDNRVSRMPSSA